MKSLLIFMCLLAFSAAFPSHIPENHFGGRIVGGHNAIPNSAPYMVTIQWLDASESTPQHFCGGAIVNENFIVTAAHCIKLVSMDKLQIAAGKHYLSVNETNEQRRSVSEVFTYPLHNEQFLPYDIGIIRVSSPFVFNDFVNKINLPEANKIHSGTATLFGWGNTSNTTDPIWPDILQTVDLPIISYDVCESIYKTGLDPSNLCTGPLSGGYDACNTDSGGPLVQNGADNNLNLVGVVSWGPSPCGQPNQPGVFVRVSAFNEWIESIINQYL